ncbi:MAG: hypothetical protein KDB65_12990 [Calditrichaeota bacterium]|nr:hypothetical protein [Calditrichota bacterium]MCB9368623.1 hypothetical protein [Calditrichota bacterium]
MRRLLTVLSIVCLGGSLAAPAFAATPGSELAYGKSSGEAILEAAFRNIERLDEQGLEVPQDLYDFYFKFEQALHPEYYTAAEREQAVTLDQFANACPGTVIDGPEGEDIVIRSYGQTYTAGNNCSYPFCRLGNDVVVQLEVYGFDGLTIRTAGSTFDTYLCLYEDACCGSAPASSLYESNNNDPSLNYGQRLAAGLQTCVSPGTYWLVLDGAGPSAKGSYCLTIEWESDACDD